MNIMNALRSQIKKQRRQTSIFQQRQSEQDCLNKLIRFNKFQHANKIGIYLHAFGEIYTHKIIEYAFQHGKEVYLPKVSPTRQALVWSKISLHQYRNQRFVKHRLGMLEPISARVLHISQLDFLIMPLLACDYLGTRIGMGGGFYDKTLARAPHKPYRLGLAHHFQFIQQPLPREKWDQPLDALLTPQQLYVFQR